MINAGNARFIARSEAAWPPQKIAELTRLYVDEGLTHAEIGRRMGISKNTVIGKVARLGLVRGSGFVPNSMQAGQLKTAEIRGPKSTLNSRLDALHAALDAILALPRPAPAPPVKQTDKATRPVERRLA